jgi:hypothetical protein
MGTLAYSEPFLKTDNVTFIAKLSGDIKKNCTYIGITSEPDKDKYCFFPTGNQLCIHCDKLQSRKNFKIEGETTLTQLLSEESVVTIEVTINISENIFIIKEHQNRFTISNTYDFSKDFNYP